MQVLDDSVLFNKWSAGSDNRSMFVGSRCLRYTNIWVCKRQNVDFLRPSVP